MGMLAVVTAGLVLGAFGQGLRVLRRDHDDRWVFYLLVVVVMLCSCWSYCDGPRSTRGTSFCPSSS